MARDWPATDVAPLIALIDDPRHRVNRGRHLPAVGRAGQGHSRSAPAAPDRARPRRNRRRARQARGRDRRLSRHPALARQACSASSRTELDARARPSSRTPRRTEIVEHGRRGRGRGPDPARGHGRHGQPHAGYIKRVPLSTYRAQRRGGKGRSGMATREEDFVTRLFVAIDPHAGAVLLLARPWSTRMKVWRLPLAPPQWRAARR
ncbi:MAG: hypothetical protein MZV49_07555 [Rhodopseudomonas palustris]|nr:hypothetical protein [Rhodopseudomonas palustris]